MTRQSDTSVDVRHVGAHAHASRFGFDERAKIDLEIAHEVVELSRARARCSEYQIATMVSEQRAKALARLADPLHEHHVARLHAQAPLHELVPREPRHGDGLGRLRLSRFHIHTIPPTVRATHLNRASSTAAGTRARLQEPAIATNPSRRYSSRMRFAGKESIQPLPPLDPEEPDDELDDDSVGELIAPFDDEPAAGDDDEPLTDPDLGIEPPSESGTDDGEPVAELDLGSGWGLVEDADGDARDEGELERSFGALRDEDLKENPGDEVDDRDGLEDGTPLVNDLELPEIDADEHGADHEQHMFGSLPTAEESALAFAEHPWRVTRLAPERERCSALASAGGAVVAGSSDLLWLDRGRSAPVRIALDGTRIASLALVGEEGDIALSVTAFGRLVRRARLASDAERLGDWRRAAETSGSGAESLEICQIGTAAPRSVVGRLTSGKLVRSDDDGNGFQPIETGFTAFALSPTGAPVAALTRDGAELQLSYDAGRTWVRRELATPAREVAGGEAPMLATSHSTLVIADRERGLVVSHDGGLAFRKVDGCASVTACTAGAAGGRSMVWAALYREANDETWVLQIDVERAEVHVIATLEGSDDGDSEQGAEAARIDRLLWDGERLFGVGDAGFIRVEPPPGA